jgi:dynein heavy chain
MLHTEVQNYDLERCKDVPDEGQNIYGLFMEGARWDRQTGSIQESEPKKLFLQMPVIYMTGFTMKEKRGIMGSYGQYGPHDAPVYKYKLRNDRYRVFRLLLKSDIPPLHWKLRACCLLLQTE